MCIYYACEVFYDGDELRGMVLLLDKGHPSRGIMVFHVASCVCLVDAGFAWDRHMRYKTLQKNTATVVVVVASAVVVVVVLRYCGVVKH
jgi:hypothetical protein